MGGVLFFFTDTATTEIYTLLYTLSLHDALPIDANGREPVGQAPAPKAGLAHVRSEEHTSELQSHSNTSYAVFCLKKKQPTRTKYVKVQHNIQTIDNKQKETH